MKSALFVDFDNVYSGLRLLDPIVAERFAMRPTDWIRWLVESLPAPPHAPSGAARRLLVRRCYLNPQVYQRWRPAFNRAGFEIIDCPPMTSQGKTSTDIHMVLDIVDLLQHQVHYDEFIVFSADADFTPVLRKLRRWDRRTTVLAIGFPSAAYQASADLLIDPDEFIHLGLGVEAAEPEPPAAQVQPPMRDKADIAHDVAAFIGQTLAASPKPVSLPWLASRLPGQVSGLDPADWGGFGSFRSLVDSLRLEPMQVRWDAGVVLDPSRHPIVEKPPIAQTASASTASERVDGDFDRIAALVREAVSSAGRPVPGGRLAQLIIDRYPAFAADWGGKGNFRRMLDALNLAPLRADWTVAGGVVTDPAFPEMVRVAPIRPAAQSDWGADGHLLPVMQQVSTATGAPLISPSELRAIVDALLADLAMHAFQLSETSKRVRDRCRDGGHAVSREDVNFVIKGILLSGHEFGEGSPRDRPMLVQAFRDSLLQLCRREQLSLDPGQTSQVLAWASRAEP